MRKQIIEYSLDYELPKDAVDDIFQILKKENAENINFGGKWMNQFVKGIFVGGIFGILSTVIGLCIGGC